MRPDSPFLSIIIPVYNVAPYLATCLDSILQQSLEDVEIILVNDGSTDGSSDIARDYLHRYPDLFRYHEQSNQGLSQARNAGLQLSRGEYILFIDGDDLVDGDGLPELVQMARQGTYDIVGGNFWHWFEPQPRRPNQSLVESQGATGAAWLYQSLAQRQYLPAIWCKLYRSELIRNKIRFVTDLIHEDQLFSIQALLKARRVCISDKPFYVYCTRSDSLAQTVTEFRSLRKIQSDFYSLQALERLCAQLDDPALGRLIMNHGFKQLVKSMLELLRLNDCNLASLETISRKLDSARPYRFLRIHRMGLVWDYLLLRRSMQTYLRWRLSRQEARLSG